MIVHELSTNAVKHGALFGEEGYIDIAWQVEAAEAGAHFRITWVERGGPVVVAPIRRGFGTSVITKMAEMSLDAETRLEYLPSGLRWQLSCPVKNALEEL
jgi:two-component sensor histidine kinase